MKGGNQEAFNAMVDHLRVNNFERAGDVDPETGSFSCRYRADDGGRCAVGSLITEENYTICIEGEAADDEVVMNAVLNSGWENIDPLLLCEMQSLHDSLYDASDRAVAERTIREIATEYGLKYIAP